MNQEVKSILKKTAKITGVTCLTLGGAALIASGAALKALTEGAKFLKDTVQQIIDDGPKAGDVIVDAVAEEIPATEATVETPAAEAAEEEGPSAEAEA